MLIIPAIDIRGGRCVRLTQGDFGRETMYSTSPVAEARRWQAEGARWLHVVDLDGAKDGRAANLSAIREIVVATSIPVQVGGGIRSLAEAEAMLGAGAARVVVGTMAFENRDRLRALLDAYAPQVVVALETKAGRLVTRGWRQEASGELLETAMELERLGVERFLYTDVDRDGTLTEPNYTELAALVGAVTGSVIASGGISSLYAVKRAKSLGAEAVIIGKALYEDRLTLKEVQDVS